MIKRDIDYIKPTLINLKNKGKYADKTITKRTVSLVLNKYTNTLYLYYIAFTHRLQTTSIYYNINVSKAYRLKEYMSKNKTLSHNI